MSDSPPSSPDAAPRRPRDAAATRADILRAACTAFSRAGYDGVGVREIAAEAGVTAMLVNRYFGSKEGLFVEAVETVLSGHGGVLAHAAALPRTAARTVLAPEVREGAPDPLLLLLRSAGSPEATAILRNAVLRAIEIPLAETMSGPDRLVRAALVLSVLTGVRFFRTVLGDRALAAMPPEDLADRLGDLVRALVEPAPLSAAAAPRTA